MVFRLDCIPTVGYFLFSSYYLSIICSVEV